MKNMRLTFLVLMAILMSFAQAEARYYDAETGRFLSEDPIGFEAGINFYTYVQNNPINANDPSGMIIPQLIGGSVNTLAGIGINLITGNEITLGGSFVDFATGAAGIGILSRLKNISKVAKIGTMALTNTGLSATNQVSKNTMNILQNNKAFTYDDISRGINTGSLIANAIPLPGGGASKTIALTTAIRTTGNPGLTFAAGILTETAVKTGQGVTTKAIDFAINSTAGGGFVLYPSKPNTNMMHQVYNK